MKITVLGCGPSSGVPTVTGDWGVCDPENPKNRRRRPSILIEKDGFVVLIDTSPDLREQLIDAGCRQIDAVLYTHEHADHVMGIDDLRGIQRHMGRNIDVYAEKHVLDRLKMRFGYLFEGIQDPEDLYRPILSPNEISQEPFNVGPFNFEPIEQDHGICSTLGFRVENFAYSTDVVRFTNEALEALRGIDTWIVDSLRDGGEHPTHANVDTTLAWVAQVGAKQAFLTHMNFQSDYDTLKRRLPDGVEPAYDGLILEV
ncbi:MAG: MBL fold metallo-hydrolase [Rhodospirillaceae bacterium]|nr:MBL fold metallo-hydrolase [Rhodospirillaceae bacterium]|tara:strand:+ start:6774 stop:7544 length:771 start_codon:yes stop_codon:yes gene_type:complete